MSLKNYSAFIFIFVIDTIISFNLVYSGNNNFENSFYFLNFTRFEILLIGIFYISVIYFVNNYVSSIKNFFLLSVSTYLASLLLAFVILWTFKVIDLSRMFVIFHFLIFFVLITVTSRLYFLEENKLYLTFDSSSKQNSDLKTILIHNTNPEELLNSLGNILKNQKINGILIDEVNIRLEELQKLIYISNYLGLDIIENQKFKIYHKSSSINSFLKNLEDIVLLVLLTPIFLIFIVLTSILILIIDGRPIFYKQTRVGANGKYFQIYKFRTMKEITLTEEDLEKLNERDSIVYKSSEDPRITKLGIYLRKLSIDELPQIFNVMKNEMSFVGPRPPIVAEVKKYNLHHLKRISIKPGITGLWQVTLRQDNSFEKWVEKDIEYIENWSVFQDIKILYKTIFEIIKMTGS